MSQSRIYTMSEEDQKDFIGLERGVKFGDLLGDLKDQNLKDQSSSKFVLSKIQQKFMKNTIDAFPCNLPLNSREIYVRPIRTGCCPSLIYDVRFVMPLLYHAVSPSLFVDCRDFIARRCLALTLGGLSSQDPQMRALCYKILERYYEHLLSALLIDKQLWINFLDLIRNSIPAPNTRLKFLFTTFLSRLIDILLHPEDKMYELIKELLAGRPRLRIDTIEIYDDLLLCSDIDYYNNNLRWLVTLFRDGIQSKSDLDVLVNLNAIPQAMCLYNSQLRFERANEAICSMFIKIAQTENGAGMLATKYSFLPWIHQVIISHIDQEPTEFKDDIKSESMNDIVRGISSLVFALIDALLDGSDDELMFLPRQLSLIDVFLALHDLIIKSKDADILQYYLNTYVRKVAKAIRKNDKIPDRLARHLLELIKAKMPYLS